jgi:hypothetical protein
MRGFWIGWLALLAGCGTALAEDSQSPTVPQTDVGLAPGSLSSKLDATGGVIHPQGTIDAAIQKPAPAMGSMPVIPPPGSPGGAPGLQPK